MSPLGQALLRTRDLAHGMAGAALAARPAPVDALAVRCDALASLFLAVAEPCGVDAVRAAQQRVEMAHAPLEPRLQLAAARAAIPVERLNGQLDRIRAVRRLAEQIAKSGRHLALLREPETAGARDPD